MRLLLYFDYSIFKNTVIETRFPSILPVEDGHFTAVAASMALSLGLTDTRSFIHNSCL